MTNQVISATEATRHFSDLLNKVRYQGQSFDIKRGSEIIARIVPALPKMKAKELGVFLRQLPKLNKQDKDDFLNTLHQIRDDNKDIRDPWA